MNKYHNHKLKVKIDGQIVEFDSAKEYRRFAELEILQRAGKIKELKRQHKFTLLPAQKDDSGRVVERPVTYIADFVYIDTESGNLVVEDVKGMRTDTYIVKRKLFRNIYGFGITEID